MRESPDVILLGEMQDLETTSIALTAAETGQLVFSTLHTIGAAKKTIDRIIDVFPRTSSTRSEVQTVDGIAGSSVPATHTHTPENGCIPAFEIMHVNDAIRNLMRRTRPRS